ncbi:MAG: RluA family pseudouridine synthase [Acidobacteriota bacterium]
MTTERTDSPPTSKSSQQSGEPKHLRLTVGETLQQERLDRFLAAATSLSRRRARDWIGRGWVYRNGKEVRVQGRILQLGDVVDLRIPQQLPEIGLPTIAGDSIPGGPTPGETDPEAPGSGSTIRGRGAPRTTLPIDPSLPILYQDDFLVVVNKPAGMLSQPIRGRRDKAFPKNPGRRPNSSTDWAADQLLRHQLASLRGERPFLHLVHRLDRRTSGILLFATHPKAPKALQQAWSKDRVTRRYLALVQGVLQGPDDQQGTEEELLVDAPIDRVGRKWHFAVSPQGKAARTRISVLGTQEDQGSPNANHGEEPGNRQPGYSLVACQLETGRTHQVRLHLAHLGHPVCGDVQYGASRALNPAPKSSLLLHAFALELPHPDSGKMLKLAAPLPPAFLEALHSTGLASDAAPLLDGAIEVVP